MAPLRALDVVFPASPRSAPRLRRTLRGFLENAHFDDARIEDVLLAAGEAASNAIEHAYRGSGGTMRLVAKYDEQRLVVEVCDGGRWRLDGDPERGRGLGIMRALVDCVAIENTCAGTSVRLEVDCNGA